jgi:hypothetical protein
MANIEEPAWRCKLKAGAIMSRLQRHAMGEIEMTDSQIKAGQAYLKKVIPDLSATTHSGDKDAPIVHTVKWGE